LIAIGLAGTILLLFFMRISHKPYDLEPFLPYIEKQLSSQGYDVRFQKLGVFFDGSLKLKGNRLIFTNKEKEDEKVIAKEAVLTLSNRNLAKGKVIPKHVEINHLKLALGLDKEAFTIAGTSFPIQKSEGQTKKSIVSYLNEGEELSPFFKYLKTIQMNDVDIIVKDDLNNETWNITNANLRFGKFFRYGEELKVSGVLSREKDEEKALPVEISFVHPQSADKATLNATFKQVHTDVLKGYIPVTHIIDGSGDIGINVDLTADNTLMNQRFDLALNDGSIYIEKGYTKPFKFIEAHIEGYYDAEDEDKLVLRNFNVLDHANVRFNIKGEVTNLTSGNPFINLQLETGDTTVLHIASYLPDRRIGKTVKWLEDHINYGDIQTLKLSYVGKPKALPNCDKTCGFDGEFDFKDLSVKFLKNTPPGTKLSGQFKMKENYISVTSEKGSIGKQEVEDVSVYIADFFNKKIQNTIHIKGKARGEIQEVLEILEKELRTNPIQKVAGRHVSQVDLKMPLKGVKLDTIQLNVASDLSKVRTNIKPIGDKEFFADAASLNVTEKDLTFSGKGLLDDLNVEAKWRETMKYFGDFTSVKVNTDIPSSRLEEYLMPLGVKMSGPLWAEVALQKQNTGDFSYQLKAKAPASTSVATPVLGWSKIADDTLHISSKGVLDGENRIYDLAEINISAEDVDITGNLHYQEQKEDKLSFDFDQFVLGRNNLRAKFQENVLNLRGEGVDLSGYKERKSLTPEKMDVKVSLDKIYFPKGAINKAEGTISIKDNLWHKANLKGKTLNNQAASFNLYTNDQKRQIIDFYAQDAGQTLKSLDVYSNIKEGVLTGHLNLAPTKEMNGKGHISIKDTRLVKAPILAQLLSLISLEQLFSSGSGIIFKDISIPLTLKEDIAYFNKVKMKGPSIGLRFEGSLGVKTDNLYVKGQLIPVSTMNKFISNIPIVGKILTGSQEGLFVADFKIKGNTANPDVSVNPLSVVTPGLLKDFFGAITGDENVGEPAQ